MKILSIRSLVKFSLGIALISALSGCFGEVVEVPTAHRGKITTVTGLAENVLTPSKVRLSSLCIVCDNLIIAEVADYSAKEKMSLFMPKDRLDLVFEVRGTFATSDSQADLNMIFDRVSPVTVTNRVSKITSNTIYHTYAQQIIRDRVRAVIAKYDIATVMENRESIGIELRDAVQEGLKGRPIKVLNFGLAHMQPPAVVIAGEETRKKREIEINEAEAKKKIRLKEAEADLEVAISKQAIELKEAETQVLVEQKLKEGFSEAYVAQRALKILEKMAASDNKVIYLPTEALKNPSVMIGSLNDSLRQQKSQ
jgi:regulator of protease activity HflC (stomatin/prohibitin superfamily)